jgi:hypothetical protein
MDLSPQIPIDYYLWIECIFAFVYFLTLRRDFDSLGHSIDDLIESCISTVLSVIAIDKMACRLVDEEGQFDMELFNALNPDDVLCAEILR